MFVAAQWPDTIALAAPDGSTKRGCNVGVEKRARGGLRGAVMGWTTGGGLGDAVGRRWPWVVVALGQGARGRRW